MGCFNLIGNISNLPILAGDDIVMFILKRKYKAKSFAPDAYIPLCLPIRGKYDDYGWIEQVDLECKNMKFVLDAFSVDSFDKLHMLLDDNEEDKDIIYVFEHAYYYDNVSNVCNEYLHSSKEGNTLVDLTRIGLKKTDNDTYTHEKYPNVVINSKFMYKLSANGDYDYYHSLTSLVDAYNEKVGENILSIGDNFNERIYNVMCENSIKSLDIVGLDKCSRHKLTSLTYDMLSSTMAIDLFRSSSILPDNLLIMDMLRDEVFTGLLPIYSIDFIYEEFCKNELPIFVGFIRTMRLLGLNFNVYTYGSQETHYKEYVRVLTTQFEIIQRSLAEYEYEEDGESSCYDLTKKDTENLNNAIDILKTIK